ncbi:hypothetical protein N6B72_15250 [Chryseobacterium soli]|uniref:hypothetical protein n=1 Tax=Chryseobacterium soli TaxID=445961 RepID=UPI0029529957|nr:hypothetical protein [Chryseobacterium soli]MDV7698280.1 hypothetical protein [Chryseobacterium soli]
MKKWLSIFYFQLLIIGVVSCNGQDKDEKKQLEKAVYIATCKGKYSTGEELTDKDKTWTLNKNEIDKMMILSHPITENEWHFSYPITPCNIDVKNYVYKGKKYNLQINGGSYVSLFDGKDKILLGCDLPDCKKYFLKKVENMEEEDTTSSLPTKKDEQSVQIKSYKVEFNKNKIQDILLVEKKDNGFILEAKSDNTAFFNKNFVCDFIDIETNTKNNQAFNLTLGYTDQYQKTFRKVVIPVFYNNNDLYIEKIFITTLGTSAKTGDEEWIRKEISKKTSLKELDLDDIL